MTSPTLFRLMTAEHTIVDIDVNLIAPNKTLVTSSTLPRPNEENIVAFLTDSGTYTIELVYFGQFSVR